MPGVRLRAWFALAAVTIVIGCVTALAVVVPRVRTTGGCGGFGEWISPKLQQVWLDGQPGALEPYEPVELLITGDDMGIDATVFDLRVRYDGSVVFMETYRAKTGN